MLNFSGLKNICLIQKWSPGFYMDFFMGLTLRPRTKTDLPFPGPRLIRELEAFVPPTSSAHVSAITSSVKIPKGNFNPKAVSKENILSHSVPPFGAWEFPKRFDRATLRLLLLFYQTRSKIETKSFYLSHTCTHSHRHVRVF